MRVPRGAIAFSIGLLLVVPPSAWVVETIESQPRWVGAVIGEIGVPPNYDPALVAYDPVNRDVYSASSFETDNGWATFENLTVLNSHTFAVVTEVPMTQPHFDIPWDLAVNSWNGDLYVTDLSGNITVIDGSTNTLETPIYVAPALGAIAFDPENGLIYVAATTPGPNQVYFGGNLTAVDPRTGATVAKLPVPTMGLTVDIRNGNVFVDTGAGITEVNGTTNQVMSSDTDGVASALGFSAEPIVYDNTTGTVDAVGSLAGAPYGAEYLSIIQAATDTTESTRSLGGTCVHNELDTIFTSPGGGDVYVPYRYANCSGGGGNTTVLELDGSTGAVLGQFWTWWEELGDGVYDPGIGAFLVAAPFNGVLYEVSPSAPPPSLLSVVLGLPNADLVFFGIFVGLVFIAVGVRRLVSARRPSARTGTGKFARRERAIQGDANTKAEEPDEAPTPPAT